MHCDMLKIQDGGAIVEKVNCVNILAINFFKYNLFCLKTPNNMYFYYLSIKLNHFGVYTPSGSLHQISPDKHLQ